MTADVISYRGPGRKRRVSDDGAARRAASIVAAALGVAAGAWLAAPKPDIAPELPAPRAAAAPADEAASPPPTVSPKRAAAPRPAPARTAQSGPAPIPLDAPGAALEEGVEILSAAELDAISQARD